MSDSTEYVDWPSGKRGTLPKLKPCLQTSGTCLTSPYSRSTSPSARRTNAARAPVDWLGHFQDYPDYITQGESLEDLQQNIQNLSHDLASGELPGFCRFAELSVA